jgi:CRP-like cAMP-binding protein
MIKIILMKKSFDPGQALFREGESGQEAYLIRSGYVSITKHDGTREVELATRGPGEIIGEMALIDESPRSATVTAKGGAVEVEIITRSKLKEMLDPAPEALVKIIQQLLTRLRDANELAAMYAPDSMNKPGGQ